MDAADPFTGTDGACMMGFPRGAPRGCGKNPELSDAPGSPADTLFQDIGW